MVRTIKNPSVPIVIFLDSDWILDISIKGRAPLGASRFTIYLQSTQEYEPDEVAFVFDVRFNFGDCKGVIVTNCKKAGLWQTEERKESDFPFCCNENFEIKIYFEDDYYKVHVNGSHVLNYNHKMSMKTIKCLRIENDVILDEVELT